MAKNRRGSSRPVKPGQSNWDKLRTRDTSDSLENRDVYNSQQLDRGRLDELRGKTGAYAGASVLGALIAVLIWVLYSIVALIGTTALSGGLGIDGGQSSNAYYVESERARTLDQIIAGQEKGDPCYIALDETGNQTGLCVDSVEEIPVPEWYVPADSEGQAEGEAPAEASEKAQTLAGQLASVSFFKLLFSVGGGGLFGLIIGSVWGKRVDRANIMSRTDDINQHMNDAHLAMPEEAQLAYDFFPNAGAHSSVQVSSQLSHNQFLKKGLGTFTVVRRATEDIYDEDGSLLYYKGEPLMEDVPLLDDDGKPVYEDVEKLDEEGNPILGDDGEPVMIQEPVMTSVPITDTLPMIDEEFGEELFTASGLPDDKRLRRRFDTRKIPYNPGGKNRDKLGAGKKPTELSTVADLINNDWEFPEYEVQRPSGAYIVDTAPVNTMVLAITRAGKGQTYIEPMIDMWSREKIPSNMVVNDPKGELLVKNYVPLVHRGFEPVQFNLINAMKTDIYNPLGMAAEAAREGDSTKCALYVENIADVFFPVDGGEDPVWPTAANNAFKRSAYGLIDYYLEEERELREFAAASGMHPATLEQRLDDLWGKVTLYNCYQLFVQLSSKKMKNPEAELKKQIENGDFDDDDQGREDAEKDAAEKAFLWEGKPEQDRLSLFFSATEALPQSTHRTMIANANNSLKAMAGAEKMLASVYGIAITAMAFFTDPTISTLTSGKPSQNTDLGSLSFPRRIGVRFSPNFVKRNNLMGQQAVWSAFADSMFTEDLGKTFAHSDMVTREGWARYYFEGKFPTDDAYIKLELRNPQTKMLIRTFYFHMRKSYLLSLDGRYVISEPVTGKKIIKNGVLRELQKVTEIGEDGEEKVVAFEPRDTQYPQSRLIPGDGSDLKKINGLARAITQTSVRYSESPKAIFLVTPPHLSKYAKLILILIKQLVDLNFDRSYMTKSSQKPLYRTRFMLDELGNLQSDGNGIAGFETMLSIGLGQEQQFTLILQTLQQLRDVYGESVDKIVQGNTSNIVFLKSTDDAMIETLEKMSGKTHRSTRDQKTVTQDMDRIIGGQNEGKVSYTISTKEEPLISYNDFAYLPPRNSIVLRAGDSPIWNRNETILPMSYRLFADKIIHPGYDYSLQTIPTMSSAMDFDVRMNQPDFAKMLDKRIAQAQVAEQAKKSYADAHGYEDVDIERLDPDIYSDEVMEIITQMVSDRAGVTPSEGGVAVIDPEAQELMGMYSSPASMVTTNEEVVQEVAQRGAAREDLDRKRYAQNTISRGHLLAPDGSVKERALDVQLTSAYRAARVELEQDDVHFQVGASGELCSADGRQVYIRDVRSEEAVAAMRELNKDISDPETRVYSEDDLSDDDLTQLSTVEIQPAFYRYLASLESWETLGRGLFDRMMAQEMRG